MDKKDIASPGLEIDQAAMNRYLQSVASEQSLPLSLIAGSVAALVGAVAWAVLVYFSDRKFGLAAIGIGFLVGAAVRYAGQGTEMIFGLVGAGFSLLGCAAGNLLTIAIFVSAQQEVSFPHMLLGMILSPSLDVELIQETFQPFDVLMYALAIYYGYKTSFRRVTQAELLSFAKAPSLVDTKPSETLVSGSPASH